MRRQRHNAAMSTDEIWVRQVKQKLAEAGFKVRRLDSAKALKLKAVSRERDRKLIASGKATPLQIQRQNSVFGCRARRFKILDYGGLNG